MKLTVVGCAPAWTLRRPGWTSSCYLIEEGGQAIVLDLGQGSLSELARYRAPESAAAILISHLHADHLVDLVPLRHYLRFGLDGKSLKLHAPADLPARLDAFLDEKGFLAPLEASALSPGPLEVKGFEVEAGRVTHIPDSFAFRVAPPGGGAGIVYSGDCGKADDLLPLIRPGDTLLCEAAFGVDEDASGGAHLTALEAARVAAEGQAARLVLTHILDEHADDRIKSAAADRFDGEIRVARPGLTLD
jgi:ribonuclease BN (tRNA processing enzyme)